MSNLTFREDGPAKVSKTDFEAYAKLMLDSGNVSEGYCVWIDENHSDGVRRLALRDILRHHGTDANANTHFKFSCGSIFMPKEPKVEETLKFRPKLLMELQEELYYCLSHQMRVYEPVKNQLIELILQLCDDDLNGKFWPYHDLAQKVDDGEIKELLDLCQPSRGMPKWLRDEIWQKITARALCDLEDTDAFETVPEYNYRVITYKYPYNTLKMLSYYFSDSAPSNDADIVVSEQIARWLEDNIPTDVVYDTYSHSLTKCVERFHDLELAYRVLRRLIMNLPTFRKDGSLEVNRGINFYLWLRGLVIQIAPEDKAFLNTINEIIDSGPYEMRVIFK